MQEILHIALDYPPNYFHLGDLLGDGRMGVVTISLCNDVVTAYDNDGRQRWIFRNDPEFETRAAWPDIQFAADGRLIPQRLVAGSCRYNDPILARHPWGALLWSNAFILDGAWKGKVFTSRYRLHMLDGASGREVATRSFGVAPDGTPDPIACVEPARFHDRPVLYVSTLHSGLYCLDERLDVLWRLADQPPVLHRGFVGDVDGDGCDEFVGGTLGYLQPNVPGYGPDAWFCLVDHDGRRLWRKAIGPGKDVEAFDRHVDWFSLGPDRIVLAEGYIFDAAGRLIADLRKTLHGHLQTCHCTGGPDGAIYFTQREPPLVAQCDARGNVLWTCDRFRAKRLHEGALMNYFGGGRREYVVEELPEEGESGPLSTYVFGADGRVLATIPVGGMARTGDWNNDGRDEIVLLGGDGYTDLRIYGIQSGKG